MKRRATKKPKPGVWFVPIRGSYLPVSAAGWLTYIPYVAYLVFVFIYSSHVTASLITTVLYVVPNWVAASAVLTWIAFHKS